MNSFIGNTRGLELPQNTPNSNEIHNINNFIEFHQKNISSRNIIQRPSHPIKCENCGKIFPLNPKQFTETGMHWCNECLTDLFSKRV